MPLMLVDHLEGCTPLTPCVSCTAASFLRQKLSSKDFSELIEILSKDKPKLNIAPSEETLNMLVKQLVLPVRVTNAFINMRIVTIRDLLKLTKGDLLRHHNFGHKSLNELTEVLQGMGLRIGQLSKD